MIAGYPIGALLIGGLAFAGIGAFLSLLICRLLRAARPGLSRRAVMAAVVVGNPVLVLLILALVGLAVTGQFSLSFVLTMRMEGWALLLAADVAAVLFARRFAPGPALKVDPATFE